MTLLASTAGASVPAKVTDDQVEATTELVGKLESLVEALDNAGSNCARAARIVRADSDKKMRRIFADLEGLAVDDDAVKHWFDRRVRESVDATTQTSAWRACELKVGFATAVAGHRVLRHYQGEASQLVATRPAALSASDVETFVAASVGQLTLLDKLRVNGSCAKKAKLVKAHTSARARKHAAMAARLARSSDRVVRQWVRSAQFPSILDTWVPRLVNPCKTHDGFMIAARAHPLLAKVAIELDVRPKTRPKAVSSRMLAHIDKLVDRMSRASATAMRSDNCHDAVDLLVRYHTNRDLLVGRLADDSLDGRGGRWVRAYIADRWNAAEERVHTVAKVCTPSPEKGERAPQLAGGWKPWREARNYHGTEAKR